MFTEYSNIPLSLMPSDLKISPGIKVAAPDSTLNKTSFERGTSNATALVTRAAHLNYDVLQDIMQSSEVEIPNNMISVIIKAMLIHGCSWDDLEDALDQRLQVSDKELVRKYKNQLFGNGLPDFNKVKECTKNRATVIGYGELLNEEAHVYNMPLPPSLVSTTTRRRLTITLVWFTPVSTSNQRYRTARLWFEASNKLAVHRQNTDYNAVQRGTVQHEIFEGEHAEVFEDGDLLRIKVNCTKDAGDFTEPIPYALLVSLEVADALDFPIYQEIKERIAVEVAIRPMP